VAAKLPSARLSTQVTKTPTGPFGAGGGSTSQPFASVPLPAGQFLPGNEVGSPGLGSSTSNGGMMSSGWSAWPLRIPSTSGLSSTYGFLSLDVAWQIVTFCPRRTSGPSAPWRAAATAKPAAPAAVNATSRRTAALFTALLGSGT
jgi:hypothetical protein